MSGRERTKALIRVDILFPAWENTLGRGMTGSSEGSKDTSLVTGPEMIWRLRYYCYQATVALLFARKSMGGDLRRANMA
jgi:hypothetical protein